MRRMDTRAWTAGFMAGEVFAGNCPYMRGSFEALDWYGGWIEGATNALGRDESLRTSSSVEAVTARQSTGWQLLRH